MGSGSYKAAKDQTALKGNVDVYLRFNVFNVSRR